MNPRWPVYIVSKGRDESRLTVKALIERGIPHRIVIEPQEFSEYSKVIDKKTILQLPFSNLGQGSIPARNWIWEHAIKEGHERHWILDDNIRYFFRMHKNKKYYTKDGTGFFVIEELVNRYENVALAGMQYKLLCPTKSHFYPLIINTRIYSCILILNRLPYRWRGRYNEDTDLSLRILKDGWATILCCVFQADKIATLTMKGGNMTELYKDDGRLKMAHSLYQQHPDVVKIARKWGRWQHQVDYSSFKKNKLILKAGIDLSKLKPNEYGMRLST